MVSNHKRGMGYTFVSEQNGFGICGLAHLCEESLSQHNKPVFVWFKNGTFEERGVAFQFEA